MARKPPPKLFYKIGEVSAICGVETHVLRYWETEFPLLSPGKNRSGQRIFRQKDMELVDTIRHLLYEEGHTIAGARKRLSEQGAGGGLPLFSKQDLPYRKALAETCKELESLAAQLRRDPG